MGGSSHHGEGAHGHGHGHGHGHHDHHHHHHPPRVVNSVINYEIQEPGHHVEDFKAPDWRKFKVENAPPLVNVQNRLANLGLKDPWLRNEVWRFDPNNGYVSPRKFILRNAGTGLVLGLTLCIGTIILETGYNKLTGKGDHGHGHGHGHH